MLPAVVVVSPGLAAKLSTVPDFLLAETCYAYCQLSNRRRLPKYRNTFVLEEGSSLTLVCAEATADKKVYFPTIYDRASVINNNIVVIKINLATFRCNESAYSSYCCNFFYIDII